MATGKYRRPSGGDGRARRNLHLGHGIRSRGAQGGCRHRRSRRAAPEEHRRSRSRLGYCSIREAGKIISGATPPGKRIMILAGSQRCSLPARRHVCIAMAKALRAATAIHRGAAVHESERRYGPGLFCRRHHRRPDHRSYQAVGSRRHRPQLGLRLQGKPLAWQMSGATSASASSSKAASGGPAIRSASTRSSSTPRPATIYGPIDSIAASRSIRRPGRDEPRDRQGARVKPSATESERMSRPPTANLEAYDYYLRAEQAARTGSRAGLRKALALYDKAEEARYRLLRSLRGRRTHEGLCLASWLR